MDPTPSTLYSVVTSSNVGSWIRLNKDHALSQLRKTFWNFSVEQENAAWHRDHPEGETMEVNKDGESVASEIGPDNYPIDLGSKALGRSKLWIRQDYIRIYDYCQKFYSTLLGEDIPPCVVITGQPGIGKTYWIRYALRRRLGEGNVVIWCRAGVYYLFVAEGVFEVPSNHRVTDFKTRVWTLVDSDDCKLSDLVHQDSQLFLMFTTSPHQARWAPLTKTTHLSIVIMNPWTREEIFQAAPLRGLTDIDSTRINELYDRFGPTPRICIDFVLNESRLRSYEGYCESAIRDLTIEQLRTFMSDGSERLNIDVVSHSIFLIKRTTVDDLHRWAMEPITTSIQSVLQRRIRECQRGEQIELYRYLAAVRQSRPTAGLVFESLAQSKLQERVELELFPMVKRTSIRFTSSGEGSKGMGWHSNHEKFPDTPATKKKRTSRFGQREKKAESSSQSGHHLIDFTPTKTVEYRGFALEDIKRGIFYVPELTNQVAFDSFILEDGRFYIFQFSIASSHTIKPGMVPFFSQSSLPPKKMWHFVFVIPIGSEISCPEPRDPGMRELMREMTLFSAELDPSK